MNVTMSLEQRVEVERMNLQPLGDRLIVEVLEEEETTVSGIVLPDTAKEKPQRGRVLSVGPGARDEDDLVAFLEIHLDVLAVLVPGAGADREYANTSRWISRKATRSSSASTAEPRSRSVPTMS